MSSNWKDTENKLKGALKRGDIQSALAELETLSLIHQREKTGKKKAHKTLRALGDMAHKNNKSAQDKIEDIKWLIRQGRY